MPVSPSILGWLVGLPALGAAVVLALPAAHARRPWLGARAISLTFGIATLLAAGRAAGHMAAAGDAGVLTLHWHRMALQMDALSLPLAMLVAAMGLVVLWGSYAIKQRVKAYFVLAQFFLAAALCQILAANALTMGLCLLAAVLFLFELLARWGGERRRPAARRFLILTLLGALCTFVGLWLRLRGDMLSDWGAIASTPASEAWSFWLTLIGLGTLAGLVLLHFWLPGALAESCTPVAMLVAAGMQTLAGYALMRCLPLFGDQVAAHRVLVGLLGTGSLVYGALAALGQTQLKRMAAFVSTALLGFFLLGLAADTPAARIGAMQLLCGRALALGLLLFVAGMLEDRTGHCEMTRLGGLSGHMPGFAGWGVVGILGATGLPGLCVFAGQLLITLGAFQRGHALAAGGAPAPRFVWLAAAAAVAAPVLLSGGIWTYQRVFLGAPRVEHSNLARMSMSERWILVVLGGAAVVMGLMPEWLRF